MNPERDQDLEVRLHNLEDVVNQTSASPPTYPVTTQHPLQTDNSQPIQPTLNRFINLFNGLSGFGKLLVIGVTALVSFAILRAVLHLVASLISLAVLGLLVYFGYKFFLARRLKNNQ